MPSISVPASSNAVATATNQGIITITSAVNLYPGTYGWLHKNDGSNQVKVKVLSITVASTTSTCLLKVFPDPNADEYGNGQQAGAFYTTKDVSAFNTSSTLDTWRQTVPVDPAFANRTLSA